jgi:hypothetical protein
MDFKEMAQILQTESVLDQLADLLMTRMAGKQGKLIDALVERSEKNKQYVSEVFDRSKQTLKEMLPQLLPGTTVQSVDLRSRLPAHFEERQMKGSS